jgi:hypothetical protein
MATLLTHAAAVVAGLAIVATVFIVAPAQVNRGLLQGTALAVTLAVTAALLLTAIRQFG